MKKIRKTTHNSIIEDKDKFGYYWTIKDVNSKNPKLPAEIWWESPHTMCIRQDNGKSADIIMLSLGQSYDLMTTIARALNCGPAD